MFALNFRYAYTMCCAFSGALPYLKQNLRNVLVARSCKFNKIEEDVTLVSKLWGIGSRLTENYKWNLCARLSVAQWDWVWELPLSKTLMFYTK